jgi:hypothetical protein
MSTYPIFRTRQDANVDRVNIQREKSRSIYLVYATQFAEFRKTIETVKDTFSQEQIWPDQCDYVIYRIKPLRKTATSIAHLAKSSKKQEDKSPSSNRYPVLVSAYYICDQVSLLIDFIREYKEITDRKTAKKSKQIQIVNSLHHLDLSLHDLMKNLDSTLKSS